jgi:hypothetical protein
MTEDDVAVFQRRSDELAREGVMVDWGGGECPVQVEGTVTGIPFYFRARGQRWRCDIGDWWRGGGVYGEDPFAAGYMPLDDAIDLIIESVRAWKKRKVS